eukprot:UN01536
MNDDIYLKMCLMEAMRMYCPIPLLLQRVCIETDNFYGYKIEKGSRIILSPQFIQNLNYNYVNPHKFEPERWLNKVDKVYNCNFMSFGFGAHQCLGRKIAMMEITIFLKHFIQNYNLKMADENNKLICLPHSSQIQNIVYSFPKHDVVAYAAHKKVVNLCN